MTRMTAEEYYNNEEELLFEVPEEFCGPLAWMAYDRGHAYGYEEVLSHLQNYVDNLLPAIKAFRDRIQGDR